MAQVEVEEEEVTGAPCVEVAVEGRRDDDGRGAGRRLRLCRTPVP